MTKKIVKINPEFGIELALAVPYAYWLHKNNQLKTDLPELNSGDSVKVNVKVSEGNRERIQTFEGVIISINGVGISKTITVRKLSFGVGVERIFPVHAPIVESIEIQRKGKVRRSKLYYLRDRIGKSAKIKEDRN